MRLMRFINFKIILIIATIMQMSVVEAIDLTGSIKDIEGIEGIQSIQDAPKLFIEKEAIDFYMFASLGQSDNVLRQMLDFAKLYNGVIVLKCQLRAEFY